MLILDLCGGTGSWSEPYYAAGYEVVVVDPFSTADGAIRRDVRQFSATTSGLGQVHGVLCAPPCTQFSVSGARWWKSKPPELLKEAISIVEACLRVVRECEPKWWALENPAGRLRKFIGDPSYSFQPWEFGDPWTKRTCIWGEHSLPVPIPCATKPVSEPGKRWKQSLTNHLSPKPTAAQISKLVTSGMFPPDWVHRLGPSPLRATLRSITPPGFARAFFLANP